MKNNLNKLDKSIICNNCLGARFYKEHEFEFNNPFMWNCIEPHEFVRLIDTFNSINLFNPSFELIENNSKQYVNAVIGDNINFNFIHYIYDKNQDTPIKVYADVLYKDILNYTKHKYFDRLNRMPDKKVFLFSTSHFLSEEHFINSNGVNLLNKLNILAKQYDIIVILDNQHKLNFTPVFKTIYGDVYGKSAIEILSKDNALDKELCKYIF